jgi:hypothetical protein
MATLQPLTFTDDILDFLASTPTLEEIIAFQPTSALEERSHYLHERNRQEALNDLERIEFDDLRRMNHFINQLKIRARLNIGARDSE